MAWRGLALALLSVLLSCSGIVPTRRTQPGTRPRAQGKRVLFDESHSHLSAPNNWTISGGYSEWAAALREDGFQVEALQTESLRAEALQGVHVFVIAEPERPFSDDERAVVAAWLQQGGGLLMLSNHRQVGLEWDAPEVFSGWDGQSPAEVSPELQKSLDSATLCGLRHSYTSTFDDPIENAVPLVDHAVVEGIQSIGIYIGTPIEVLDGTAVLGTRDIVYVAASTVGRGRCLAHGDANAFSDGTFSDGSRSRYNNWVQLDNAQFAKNMVLWLAELPTTRAAPRP